MMFWILSLVVAPFLHGCAAILHGVADIIRALRCHPLNPNFYPPANPSKAGRRRAPRPEG
jgi:uncharacterized membrane protein HdeD (DUF308 family)